MALCSIWKWYHPSCRAYPHMHLGQFSRSILNILHCCSPPLLPLQKNVHHHYVQFGPHPLLGVSVMVIYWCVTSDVKATLILMFMASSPFPRCFAQPGLIYEQAPTHICNHLHASLHLCLHLYLHLSPCSKTNRLNIRRCTWFSRRASH